MAEEAVVMVAGLAAAMEAASVVAAISVGSPGMACVSPGERFAPQHSSRGHYRYGRPYSYGDPYWYDYPYYGYYDYDDGDYSDAQASPSESGAAEQTNIAVQQELAKRGFYQGPIDGSVGPETRKAISWFQSVEKLSATGQVDGPTLEALQIR
jgi:hypothetical protein